jgi:uncharacterized protein YggE
MKSIVTSVILTVLIGTAAIAKEAQITVFGTGVITAVPDMASITMGVTTQGTSAAEAMSSNSSIMQKVIESLKQANIEEKDIQTTDINLNPIWDRRNNDGTPPNISGYQASNNVFVRVLDLESLGTVLDTISKTGANNFHGISFGLQDRKPIVDQARIAAVQDARAKAELYAKAAGVSVTDVMEISESSVRAQPRNLRMAEAMSTSSVPISEGTLDITANITIVYGLD